MAEQCYICTQRFVLKDIRLALLLFRHFQWYNAKQSTEDCDVLTSELSPALHWKQLVPWSCSSLLCTTEEQPSVSIAYFL